MVDVTRNDHVELTTNNGKHTGKVMYFNKNKDTNDYEIKLKDVTTESGRKIRLKPENFILFLFFKVAAICKISNYRRQDSEQSSKRGRSSTNKILALDHHP
jgi:hypothetical protein